MKVGILGSGFGLYGYLPALLTWGAEQIFLPERYRAVLSGRADVGHLAEQVRWCVEEATLLDTVDAVVVARRPEDQVALVAGCRARDNIRRVLLEKPIAPDPAAAEAVIDDMASSGKVLRIGYTFRYTHWGKRLLQAREAGTLDGAPRLAWHFRAHHRKTGLPTWKREVAMGGGVMRFFGIHLIALLSELGYTQVLASEIGSDHPGEADRWRATFGGTGLPPFQVDVDANAAGENFSIDAGATSVGLAEPFQAEPLHGRFDRRVGGLAELCSDFLGENTASLPWYRASVRLWSEAERATRQVPVG